MQLADGERARSEAGQWATEHLKAILQLDARTRSAEPMLLELKDAEPVLSAYRMTAANPAAVPTAIPAGLHSCHPAGTGVRN